MKLLDLKEILFTAFVSDLKTSRSRVEHLCVRPELLRTFWSMYVL